MNSSIAILLVMALIMFSLDKSYSTDDESGNKCAKTKRRENVCRVCGNRSGNDEYYSECCESDYRYHRCLDLLRN
uniref:Kappa-scoloptoxin(03)-Ssm1a n=1 Tax=Scolopendra mutilans TaxID=2836329 RepID=TX31A_SCOMU|nr:RecName: Full=Kappa-scoloptoxin(03)-Ssm1a; Short=Kappa-SLPTX(03)-Ssm1a; AltName: Full=Kappa-scoloptoxin-Ssm1a; Short=Kappa-SLPTX-Ssm1a; Flags: Precursor [Scolopendra mutilans]AFM55003.1 kappa-SLPTX-Ssm1a neurotoxin precursor [Scolopendra subspinipes]